MTELFTCEGKITSINKYPMSETEIKSLLIVNNKAYWMFGSLPDWTYESCYNNYLIYPNVKNNI